jgi:hypothetical protein
MSTTTSFLSSGCQRTLHTFLDRFEPAALFNQEPQAMTYYRSRLSVDLWW